MKYILLVFLTLTIAPAFAQDPKIGDYLDSSNHSLIIQEKEITYYEFNKVLRDLVIVEFGITHEGSW